MQPKVKLITHKKVISRINNNAVRISVLAAVLLNIAFIPLNISITPAAAVAAANDPLSQMMNDGDPAHASQVQAMVKAVQSGADTDPVHVSEVNAFLAAQGTQAPTAQPSAASSAPAPTSAPTPVPTPTQTSTWVDPDPVHQAQAAAAAAAATQTQAAQPPSQTQQQPQPAQQTPAQTGLYVDPNSDAANQARAWSNWSQGADKMNMLAAQPTAKWFGGWSGDVQSTVSQYVGAAASAGKIPVLVAYNIPERDCGGYSAGGASDYTSWIGNFARGIGNNKAIVILEPDSLAQMSCLSATDQQHRYDLLSGAVSILKSNGNTQVYIDAGHDGWVPVGTMANELQKANVGRADGFALDVSNFGTTADESTYGAQISQQIGNKHFVIDTSRNGSGSINGQWCNPWGATIGN
ncbi:MAG TPA: glycoside hydrolase family 6 protein, partial [Candidatus Paceibacterota bacterium]